MDSARWQQLEEVFHHVVELPAGDARAARVRELCGHDESLAQALMALLAEDERFERTAELADPHIGLRLGSYQVHGLIARGGMGAVYEAHRADDQFHQRVAIKIMDVRLSDPTLVAQFKAERQILAALEHPTLTRLLDGGVTPLGEPYLVMEFVDGQPIDRYCDQHRLDVAGRLRLFAEVCEGVDWAHRNLVLHRDLKPANILITSDGHAKVVDFGTATLLQPERLMTVSVAPLTPAYASPEQLLGQPVGTATDQYSLGLVLYQLLTGVTPFAARTSLMAAIERALAGAAPTAPHLALTGSAVDTRRTSLARLRRQLAGDLGTIVRKTLSVAPADRYATVQQLADDLTRWTQGKPILGRAPSMAYRSSRFVRRHWVSVSIAVVLLLSLLSGTVISLRQASIARAESGKARQLNRFLTRMLSSANPSWYNVTGGNAGSITVRQVLDGAGELISSELGATPEVEAEMRRTLGRTYIGMADPDRALAHLERALVLYRADNDEFGEAFTQALLGEHAILKGDYKTAETRLRASLAYVRSLGEVRTDPELHMMATNDLGVAISSQRPGDPEATALKLEALEVADRDPSSAGAAVVGRANISLDFINAGQLDAAETLLRDALRRMALLPAPLPERGFVFNNLSHVLRTRGHYAEAERFGAEAAEAATQVWGVENVRWAAFTTTWGRALVADGQVERGRATLAEAYNAYRRTRPADHGDLVGPLVGLGSADRLLGQLVESERVLREAHAIVQRQPAQRARAAEVAGELGLTLRTRGQSLEAEVLLEESHALFQAAYGDAHPFTKMALARVQGTQ